MPYADPARKREWEQTHRPDRFIELNRKKDAKRLDRLTRMAYEESEASQRAIAAFDDQTSWDVSLAAQRRRARL